MQTSVSGGEGCVGIYGTITRTGMHSILCAMRDVTEEWGKLGPGSTLVDIGSGLGRPLLHAMVTIGVKATFGIECDEEKVRGWLYYLICTRCFIVLPFFTRTL